MKETKSSNTVFVQVIDRPARKLILRRGIKAEHYLDYYKEVGCEVWGILCSIEDALYEPIGMWLPEHLRKPGTSVYAQGVEVPVSYTGQIPVDFDIIELKPCKYMIFQGPPFNNEDFMEVIHAMWAVMEDYDTEFYGFAWADQHGPRFQLEPQGERGYIEARPVVLVNQK